MAEYIEKNKAINAVFEAFADGRSAYIALEAIPAADVAPVRHGRWISDGAGKRFGTVVRLDKDGCPVDTCHCSECGEWLTASDEYPVIGRYCPNCGAKMEEGNG